MRRPDACSRQTRRPAGVTLAFQVIENSVKPPVGNRALNLLSKDRDRAALANEPRPMRPEMPIVGPAVAFPGARERLAGATTRPNRSVVGPSGESEGQAPTADPGEEVTLGEACKVARLDVDNGSLINFSVGNVARLDQLAQPGGSERIVFVVVGAHAEAFRWLRRRHQAIAV